MTQFVKPNLPSSVISWVGDQAASPRPSDGSIVAIPIVANWGPEGVPKDATGKPMLLTGFPAYRGLYSDDDTAGRDAVVGAFNGMGLEVGGGGAGGIYTYRMTTSSAAAAGVTLNNSTPAAAIHFDALYKGTRGNNVAIVIEDDPALASNDRCRVLLNGATVETYTYPQTDIDQLVSRINGRPSTLVKATRLITGTQLTPTSQAGTPLTGGNDGSAVGAPEFQAALDAFEYKDFGIFSPFNVTDGAIKAQIFQWLQNMAAEMRPVRAVFGGASGEDVSTAIADAALMRDPHVIRFGVGTYHDDLLNKDLSTAQLAPRIAGVLAARGLRSALTRAELGGLSALTGPATDELAAARDGGVTVLRQISSDVAELAVSQGVSTFIDKTSSAMPYDLFSEPRIVGLFDYVLRTMTKWGDENIIGDVPVTADSRLATFQQIGKILGQLERDGLAEPGTSTADTPVTDDPALKDAIPYTFGLQPTRTANYLIGQGQVK